MNQLISIIVPVYNVEKYIQTCIESIINQTYKNWELLLVDDGSIDKSAEICKTYRNKDPRIKFYAQSNAGVSVARNKGLELAEGAFITFIDGDDYVHYDYLTTMYQSIQKYDAEICNCNFRRCNPANPSYSLNKSNTNIVLSNISTYNRDEAQIKYLSTHEFPPGVCGCFYSRDVLKSICFNVNITHGEDFLFNWACLCRAKKVLHIDQALYYYVQYNESVSHMFTEKRLTEFDARSIFYNEICTNYPEYKKLALNFIFQNSCGIMMNFLDSEYNIAKERTYNYIRQRINNTYSQYTKLCCNYKYNIIWFLISNGYRTSYITNKCLIRMIKQIRNMLVGWLN